MNISRDVGFMRVKKKTERNEQEGRKGNFWRQRSNVPHISSVLTRTIS